MLTLFFLIFLVRKYSVSTNSIIQISTNHIHQFSFAGLFSRENFSSTCFKQSNSSVNSCKNTHECVKSLASIITFSIGNFPQEGDRILYKNLIQSNAAKNVAQIYKRVSNPSFYSITIRFQLNLFNQSTKGSQIMRRVLRSITSI